MDAIVSDVFEKILQIAARRAVAEEDLVFEVRVGGRLASHSRWRVVSCAWAARSDDPISVRGPVKELAVVVSADMEVAFVHQQVGCGGSLERP